MVYYFVQLNYDEILAELFETPYPLAMLAWWVAVAISLLSMFVLLLLQRWRNLTEEKTVTKAAVGNVLLITAHPDDECMFFSPTLLTLTQTTEDSSTRRVYLLCLSEG